MSRGHTTGLSDAFNNFYKETCPEEIGELAQKYPSEQKSLYVDWQELYRFDSDLADDVQNHPEKMREYTEEALRLYDLPADVLLGQAHVRFYNLSQATKIREISADQ